MDLRSWLWRAVYRLNRTSLCRFRISLGDHTFVPPTCDRLLHLVLIRLGLMGSSERRLFRDLVSDGNTAVDVGANQGVHTFVLSDLVGKNGRVWAFEPERELYDALRLNLERNAIGNVSTFNCALGGDENTGVLRISPIHSGGHSLDHKATTGEGTQLTEIHRLDNLLGEEEIEFVKIDVQGAEPEVMEGMSEILARSPGIRVLLEFWPRGLERLGHSPLDFFESLEGMGFFVHHAEPPYRVIRDGRSFLRSVGSRSWINVLLARSVLTRE